MNTTAMSQDRTALENAINRSQSHNESVRVTVSKMDRGSVLDALRSLIDANVHEFDYIFMDRKGVNVLDVWAYDPADPDIEMVWRIIVAFMETTSEQ